MTTWARRGILLGTAALALIVTVSGIRHAVREPALTCEGRTLTEWLPDLDNPDEKARNRAEQAIVRIGAPAIPTLRASLRRRDSFLTPLFRKVEPHLPRWAWRQLWRIVRPDELDVNRRRAARSLALMGAAATPAIPDLIEALHSPYTGLPWQAADALARIGTEAVPALTSAFPGAPYQTRRMILSVLERNGLDAAPAIPLVLDVVVHSSSEEEIGAATGVLRSLGTAALPALFESLASPEVEVRKRAQRALQSIVESTPWMILRIVERYHDQPPPVRAAIVEVLGEANATRNLVGWAMASICNDPDLQLRQRALDWLREHFSMEEAERLLRAQPDHVRQLVRDSYVGRESE